MTAVIIPFHVPYKPPADVRCSFCGTPKDIAKMMFAGIDGKNICNKCVTKAAARAADSEGVKA